MLTSPRSIVVIRSLSHAKYSRAKSDCSGEGMLKQIRLIAVWETRVDNFQKLCERRQRVVQVIPVNRFSPVQTLPFAIKRNVGLIADFCPIWIRVINIVVRPHQTHVAIFGSKVQSDLERISFHG